MSGAPKNVLFSTGASLFIDGRERVQRRGARLRDKVRWAGPLVHATAFGLPTVPAEDASRINARGVAVSLCELVVDQVAGEAARACRQVAYEAVASKIDIVRTERGLHAVSLYASNPADSLAIMEGLAGYLRHRCNARVVRVSEVRGGKAGAKRTAAEVGAAITAALAGRSGAGVAPPPKGRAKAAASSVRVPLVPITRESVGANAIMMRAGMLSESRGAPAAAAASAGPVTAGASVSASAAPVPPTPLALAAAAIAAHASEARPLPIAGAADPVETAMRVDGAAMGSDDDESDGDEDAGDDAGVSRKRWLAGGAAETLVSWGRYQQRLAPSIAAVRGTARAASLVSIASASSSLAPAPTQPLLPAAAPEPPLVVVILDNAESVGPKALDDVIRALATAADAPFVSTDDGVEFEARVAALAAAAPAQQATTVQRRSVLGALLPGPATAAAPAGGLRTLSLVSTGSTGSAGVVGTSPVGATSPTSPAAGRIGEGGAAAAAAAMATRPAVRVALVLGSSTTAARFNRLYLTHTSKPLLACLHEVYTPPSIQVIKRIHERLFVSGMFPIRFHSRVLELLQETRAYHNNSVAAYVAALRTAVCLHFSPHTHVGPDVSFFGETPLSLGISVPRSAGAAAAAGAAGGSKGAGDAIEQLKLERQERTERHLFRLRYNARINEIRARLSFLVLPLEYIACTALASADEAGVAVGAGGALLSAHDTGAEAADSSAGAASSSAAGALSTAPPSADCAMTSTALWAICTRVAAWMSDYEVAALLRLPSVAQWIRSTVPVAPGSKPGDVLGPLRDPEAFESRAQHPTGLPAQSSGGKARPPLRSTYDDDNVESDEEDGAAAAATAGAASGKRATPLKASAAMTAQAQFRLQQEQDQAVLFRLLKPLAVSEKQSAAVAADALAVLERGDAARAQQLNASGFLPAQHSVETCPVAHHHAHLPPAVTAAAAATPSDTCPVTPAAPTAAAATWMSRSISPASVGGSPASDKSPAQAGQRAASVLLGVTVTPLVQVATASGTLMLPGATGALQESLGLSLAFRASSAGQRPPSPALPSRPASAGSLLSLSGAAASAGSSPTTPGCSPSDLFSGASVRPPSRRDVSPSIPAVPLWLTSPSGAVSPASLAAGSRTPLLPTADAFAAGSGSLLAGRALRPGLVAPAGGPQRPSFLREQGDRLPLQWDRRAPAAVRVDVGAPRGSTGADAAVSAAPAAVAVSSLFVSYADRRRRAADPAASAGKAAFRFAAGVPRAASLPPWSLLKPVPELQGCWQLAAHRDDADALRRSVTAAVASSGSADACVGAFGTLAALADAPPAKAEALLSAARRQASRTFIAMLLWRSTATRLCWLTAALAVSTALGSRATHADTGAGDGRVFTPAGMLTDQWSDEMFVAAMKDSGLSSDEKFTRRDLRGAIARMDAAGLAVAVFTAMRVMAEGGRPRVTCACGASAVRPDTHIPCEWMRALPPRTIFASPIRDGAQLLPSLQALARSGEGTVDAETAEAAAQRAQLLQAAQSVKRIGSSRASLLSNLKAGVSSKLAEAREKVAAWFESIVKNCMRPPSSAMLQELTCFFDDNALKAYTSPSPMLRMLRGLHDPGFYMPCKCCTGSVSRVRHHEDISLAFRTLCHVGDGTSRWINVSEWFRVFRAQFAHDILAAAPQQHLPKPAAAAPAGSGSGGGGRAVGGHKRKRADKIVCDDETPMEAWGAGAESGAGDVDDQVGATGKAAAGRAATTTASRPAAAAGGASAGESATLAVPAADGKQLARWVELERRIQARFFAGVQAMRVMGVVRIGRKRVERVMSDPISVYL